MGVEIGILAMRRSIFIKAPPERVWQEFEDLEHMRQWFGTGHTLVQYEPRVGGTVETNAGESDGEALRFVGRVLAFEPPHEVTFEQDWEGHGWASAPLVTIRLTGTLGGTLVELFHHGFERNPESAADDLAGFEGGWTLRQLEALRRVVEGAG